MRFQDVFRFPARRSKGRLLASVIGLATVFAAADAHAQVGLTRVLLGQIPVTLVYPSDAPVQPLAEAGFEIEVALDAPPRPGPHRLVLLSHGSGGSAMPDFGLASTLARAGFIVAQPLHAGDNVRDASRAGPVSWASRPGEISAVIDALAAHPRWQPLLQLDKVGVHGISAGGGTALVMAGARWRMLELLRHCREHGVEDEGFCYYGATSEQARAERKAAFALGQGTAEEALPAALTAWQGGRDAADPRPDPRVAAASAAVPMAVVFSSASLAAIRIPVAVLGAGRDTVLLPRFHSQHVLQHCGACVALDELRGAGHFDLLDPWPAAMAQSVGASQLRGGLPEPGFDPALRQRAFEQLADFYRRALR